MRKGFLAKLIDFSRQTQWVWQPMSMGLAPKVNAITKH